MKQKTQHKSPSARNDKGFALISTIVVMSLLLMICLGMISLSAITSQNTTSSSYLVKAEANARMSLMMALGQIQQELGPDQRVSALSAIFDTDPETIEIDGVNSPNVLGTWSTLTESGEPIIYKHSDGFHKDHRNKSDSAFEDHRQNVRSWLISGHDTGFDPRTSSLTLGEDAVILGYNEANPVAAPKIRVFDSNSNSSGAYAYHVKDLGLAAPLLQINPNVAENPDPQNPDNGGYANLYTGSRRQYDSITETKDALTTISEPSAVADAANAGKRITYQSLAFDKDGNSAKSKITAQFLTDHEQQFTDSNSALLTNTLDGGFRTDLTSYIKNSADPGAGQLDGASGRILNDSQPILDEARFKNFSPKFGAIRDYFKLGALAGADRTLAPRAPVYGGGFKDGYPDPTNVIKHGIHPVIAEYSTYNRPVIDSSSSSNMSILIYPRVTLWNPYNIKIETAGYFVQINQRSYMRITVNDDVNGDGNDDEYTWTSPYWGNYPPEDAAKGKPAFLYFFIDPVEIEPGQALVFTPAHSGTQKLEYRDGNIQNNRLTAYADPQDLSSFNVPMGGPAASTSKSLTYKFMRYYENGFHVGYEESTSARLRLSSGTAPYSSVIASSAGKPSYPIVHTLDIHNWIRGNEGRWHDINRPPLPLLKMSTSTSVPPDNRTKLGLRLKALNETAENLNATPNGFWTYPIIETSNLRAPIYRRTPWDWIQTNPTTLHEYSFGPFAGDDQEAPGYIDPFMLPRLNSSGLAETSPFLDTSSVENIRFPIFDIPPANLEVFSIGQLRQVPLTHEFGSPSFIIGESLATPTSPRQQSAYDLSSYTNSWSSGFNLDRVTNYSTWWQDEYDPSQSYSAFDYRFETNHALWDKYFFSTIPASQPLANFKEMGSLPNPSMVVEGSTALLADSTTRTADKIGSVLRLKNHHSVNSTNLLAWKALLSMNRGMDIGDNKTAENQTPFPGMSMPTGDGTDSRNSTDEATWRGYRQLTDNEIETLSLKIVEQVKRRAPFISISDFVNRRLIETESPLTSAPDINSQSSTDLLSYAGTLEIAIRQTALNAALQDQKVNDSDSYVTPSAAAPKIPTANLPTERFSNAPAALTQGKLLETIGATITARSDTFKIRAYGEAYDSTGKTRAKAWCEATVQRTSNFFDSVDKPNTKADDLTSDINRKNGRKFEIISFRWLNKEELSSN